MSNVVPEGWKWSTLGNYINIGRGYAFKSEDYESNGVPVVRVTNIESDGRLNLTDNVVFLRTAQAANYSEYELNGDDVLIVMVGATVGKLARVEAKYASALLNQNMWRLVVKSKSDSCQKYAYYAVQPVVDRFLSSQQGSARGFLTQKDFSLAETIIPPLPEQQKIATILSSVDDVIEKTQAQIDKLQDLKAGMMQELLTKGIGHTDFKDSPVGRIPVGWDYLKMNSIAKVTDGAHHTPKYTTSGVPFLRVTDLKNKDVFEGNIKYVSEEEHQELIKRCKPEKGDILYSKNGTIGIPRLIDWDDEFSIFVSLALIKIHSDRVLPRYLALFMDSPIVREQIRTRSKQGTVTNLHLEEIRDFDIPLPNLNEQAKIADSLGSIVDKLVLVEEKLHANLNIKKALMQDLLTGRVRVKVD